MEMLHVNDIVVLKPEEVLHVKPFARPWFEGPYVVRAAGWSQQMPIVEVSSLCDGKPLQSDSGTNWIYSSRFTVLSDADIFGTPTKCAITGDTLAVALLVVEGGDWSRRAFWTEKAQSFWDKAAALCGFPCVTQDAASITKLKAKTRVDNARIIFCARELYAKEVQAHGVPTVPQQEQALPKADQPLRSAKCIQNPQCTVSNCHNLGATFADNRFMCADHAKQYAEWQQEQNRQIEQAKAALDRPFRAHWLGSGDVGCNPWNR